MEAVKGMLPLGADFDQLLCFTVRHSIFRGREHEIVLRVPCCKPDLAETEPHAPTAEDLHHLAPFEVCVCLYSYMYV